jgi:hypothetical protein
MPNGRCWFPYYPNVLSAGDRGIGRYDLSLDALVYLLRTSAAILDSQSVKTTAESGTIKGYDAAKEVKGRKRYLLVDTLGLLLAVHVMPADVQERAGGQRLLSGLKPL